MIEMRLQNKAVQKQTQSMKMTQQQIMSLKMLSMGSMELREAVYEAAEKNPAIEIVRDDFSSGTKTASEKSLFSDDIHYGSSSAAGQLASDNFQAALESSADTRETLQDHLEHQFMSVNHSDSKTALGLRLIHNLDDRGFHILAPVSLIDRNDPFQNEELLDSCIDEIRHLDPVGCCCSGSEESLLVQAELSENCPSAALFFLKGHLSFLDPPVPSKILRKVNQFLAEQKELAFSAEMKGFSESEVAAAVDFIKTLDPFPARNFGFSENRYIFPDVYVSRRPFSGGEPGDNEILSSDGKYVFSVTASADVIPRISVSRDFDRLSKERTRIVKSTEATEQKRAEHRFVMDSVRDAKSFIENIRFRESSVLKACVQIVSAQLAFFEKGPGSLVPLRQKDIAESVGVHETTVSRIANGKFLECEWGLFEISYFFTNAVKSVDSDGNETASSKESVKHQIAQILDQHKNDGKPLSDQKLSDILAEKGIRIARRTVAKYRAELNISSSYKR